MLPLWRIIVFIVFQAATGEMEDTRRRLTDYPLPQPRTLLLYSLCVQIESCGSIKRQSGDKARKSLFVWLEWKTKGDSANKQTETAGEEEGTRESLRLVSKVIIIYLCLGDRKPLTEIICPPLNCHWRGSTCLCLYWTQQSVLCCFSST